MNNENITKDKELLIIQGEILNRYENKELNSPEMVSLYDYFSLKDAELLLQTSREHLKKNTKDIVEQSELRMKEITVCNIKETIRKNKLFIPGYSLQYSELERSIQLLTHYYFNNVENNITNAESFADNRLRALAEIY